MSSDIFVELSKILVITVAITGFVRLLKQPAIIGYILSGIIVGPFVLNIIDSSDTLTAFSQIGVALLLFFVGLNLNPKVIKDVGKISLITGIGQVVFTASVGFLISKALGLSTLVSVYVAIALTFSSTIIIMKLLSDKKDLESLYGRIAIGFLIVQDFIAIGILLVISSLSNGSSLTSLALGSFLKGMGAMLLLFIFTKYIMPPVIKIIAKSQEFLLLFSISWCFAIATIFHYLNFSIEAGALLAGMTLSVSPYHFEISSKMKPLRDFFLVLFFIVLGSQMTFSNLYHNIGIIMIFSLFVMIGNPIIVMTLMGFLGYTKRNSFLAGLTVAQISEFSLIVVALGVSVGHVSNEILSLVTAVGLITFAGSTYMILYANKLYPALSNYLSIFEKKGRKVDEHKYHEKDDHEIILVGYNRIGFDILESLKKIKKKFLIIDYDPEVITKLFKEGYDCRYGDAEDSEFLNEVNFSKAKMVVSTIPLIDTNMLLINKVKEDNKKAIIAVVSHQIDDAVRLYDEGATYVLMPHFLGGKHFSTMIEKNKTDINKFIKEKMVHLEHLNRRKEAGHEHPTHVGR
ncbi:MAG: cation:proton antiporter [Candidatus Woesearchaeota archaeon]|nr:MAG: cation:proton antiporter [Candidatus Woesearchaeota archaeon]